MTYYHARPHPSPRTVSTRVPSLRYEYFPRAVAFFVIFRGRSLGRQLRYANLTNKAYITGECISVNGGLY